MLVPFIVVRGAHPGPTLGVSAAVHGNELYLGKAPEKMYRGRFRLAGNTAWTDAGFTGERDRHTDVAGLALEQSDSNVGVPALFEFEERLLDFLAKRAVGTLIAALVDGHERV